MSETLEYLQMFARFPFAARRFFQHTLTLEEARQIVRERMEHREENFLRVVERSVYGYPRSPYLPLLKMAGCEMDDLRAMVKQKGLENALRQLREEGVYITYEELKGRKPIVRGGTTFPVRARDFDNPFASGGITMESSGSTGLASTVNQDLEYLAATSPNLLLSIAANGIQGAPVVSWSPFLPGPGLRAIFQTARIGMAMQKWFAPAGWRDSKFWFKYSVATLYMLLWVRILANQAAFPRVVKPDHAAEVARWIADTLRKHRRCLLLTGVSRGMRVCLAAEHEGLDLDGLVIRIGGEPATPAKVVAMRRVGARLIAGYAISEVGALAHACPNSSDAGDMHLFKDMIALITHPHPVKNIDMPVSAFNLTSLLNSAPKILFNFEVDDYGIVEERACGCELESLGYTTHIRNIQSYTKLVGEGATLIGNDLLRVLEQELPTRFGGTLLDYQLMEQEDEKGFTRLFLVIHPSVKIADEHEVIKCVLDALRAFSPMADAARTVWQNAQTLQIKRQEPVWTASGKLMPLHVQRRAEVRPNQTQGGHDA